MRYAVLLRAVNLGSHNRLAMPELRALLERAGFDGVATYLQSGNVVLESRLPESRLVSACRAAIAAELGLELELVARSAAELAAIVARHPLADVATNPKRCQVTFLEGPPTGEVARRVAAAAGAHERVVVDGREIYAWHPDGVGRSRLAGLLGGRTLGVVCTARNWATVTALRDLAAA